jgi:hypothetical protein
MSLPEPEKLTLNLNPTESLIVLNLLLENESYLTAFPGDGIPGELASTHQIVKLLTTARRQLGWDPQVTVQ